MVVLGRRGAGKDLANEVDNGTTTCAKFANDFEFKSNLFVVCNGRALGRLVGPWNETKRFTLKGNPLTNNIALGKDVVFMKGDAGARLCEGKT